MGVADDTMDSNPDLVPPTTPPDASTRARAETLLSMDSAAIGMAITLPDGRFAQVNRALCRVLGYHADELVGRTFADITFPEDLESGLRAFHDLELGLRDSFSQRKRYVTSSGDPVWIDLSVTAVRDASGALVQTVAQMVNVTAEVYNLEALTRTVERFRKLAENATDVVFEVDSHGQIVWVSPSITPVLGWDPDLLIGTGATALLDPDDTTAVHWLQVSVRGGGPAADIQARFRTTHGDIKYMAAKASQINIGAGAPSGAVIGLRDVTSERNAARSLERSERLFRLSLLGAPHGIALADADGRLTQANPALCELLGLDSDQVAGHRIDDFLHEEDKGLPDSLIPQLAATGKVTHEHRLISKNRTVWVEHSVALLRDADGSPEMYVHQFSDQTRTRQLLQNLAYQAARGASADGPDSSEFKRQLLSRVGLPAAPRAGQVGVFFCSVDELDTLDAALASAPDGSETRNREAVLDLFSERISAVLRATDSVTRTGDEFVVLCECDGSPGALEQISERIKSAMTSPVSVGETEVSLSVSIGIALTHPDDPGAQPVPSIAESPSAEGRHSTTGRDG